MATPKSVVYPLGVAKKYRVLMVPTGAKGDGQAKINAALAKNPKWEPTSFVASPTDNPKSNIIVLLQAPSTAPAWKD
jgi:hypothetical protein